MSNSFQRFVTRFLVAVFFLLISFLSVYCGEVANDTKNSSAGTLLLQLELFDLIARENPNYEDTIADIASITPQQEEERFSALTERNLQNPRITEMIDKLLSSPAYVLYYRQFKNVSPDLHRRIFASLPYRPLPSPADIGQVQLDLFRHRDSLKILVQKISEIDMAHAVSVARNWVPPGEPIRPTTYFIMDGNGDAFARDNAVCFDLFGVIIQKRPRTQRFSNLGTIATTDIEQVLAHEFQHVFASPFLYPPNRQFDNWQDRWEDLLIRRLVSEGVAMQCNPPAGFKKTVFEDSAVVNFWLRELERTINQIRKNQTTEDSVSAWQDRGYHQTARELLIDFLNRNYPDSNLTAMLEEHITERPSCIYTLGWWMVSHIVSTEGGHEKAIELLSNPDKLFDVYNASNQDAILRIKH